MAIEPENPAANSSSGQPYPHHNASGQRQHLYGKARLRPWGDPEERSRINCFDKQPGAGRLTYLQSLRYATVARGLWSAKTEEDLSRIENGANPAFDILTAEAHPILTTAQRGAIARCISSFWRRNSAWLVQQPGLLATEVARLLAEVRAAPDFTPEEKSIVEEEAANFLATPPARPLPLDLMVRTFSHMSWTVLCSRRGFFLTGDSPVIVSPEDVLISPDTELVMSISPVRALVCNWGIQLGQLSTFTASPGDVREVNRRIAQGAVRRIYSNAPLDPAWVRRLLRDSRPTRTIHPDQPTRIPSFIRDEYAVCVRQFPQLRTAENRQLIDSLRNATR